MVPRIRKWLTLFAVAVLGLCLAAWLCLTFVVVRPSAYQPSIDLGAIELLSWPEHDKIYAAEEFPYLLELDSATGHLLYLGCRHTAEATDPQLVELENWWQKTKPTVALCEGRERMNRFKSRPDSGPYSESQLVRTLAYRYGTKLYSLEPKYDDEVAGLLKYHSAKDVATYLFLRAYTSEIKGYTGDHDALALSLLKERTDVESLQNTFDSLESFDQYWRSSFSDSANWRTLPDTEAIAQLVEIGNSSRQVRGEHMVRTVVELVRNGERVFAVVGASHVIRQEPFLRRTFASEANPQ